MTNIAAIVIVPLPVSHTPQGSGWSSGAAYDGDAPHISGKMRLANYANTQLLKELLDPRERSHRGDDHQVGRVILEMSELVQLPERVGTGRFLIWHLRPGAEVTADQFLTDIALLARTGRDEFRTFFGVAAHDLAMPTDLPPRLPTIVLSGPPEGTGGLFNWPGSSAESRRLVDMITLPDYSRETSTAYEPETIRPTPRYLAAISGTALGVLRLQPLEDRKILEMRTLWLDAFLLELVCSDSVATMESATTALAIRGDRKQWNELEDRFRQAKSVWLSRTTSDHPMETGIGSLVRKELNTDARLASLREELDAHAGHLARRANESLGIAVAILALLTAIVPLLLFVAEPGTSWDAPAFIAACVISVALIGGALWVWARKLR